MKTKKDAVAPAKEATLADIADNLLAPPALPGHSASGEQYLYFTERDIERILDNLDGLRNMVFPLGEPLDEGESSRIQQFPSVCLIGLGRCGSNIALDGNLQKPAVPIKI